VLLRYQLPIISKSVEADIDGVTVMRKPETPPDWTSVWGDGNGDAALAILEAMRKPEVQDFVREANDSYLHWDKFRFSKMPEGVDHKTVWTAVQFSRMGQLSSLPVTFLVGQFRYWVPPKHLEWLSYIDKKAGGYLVGRNARPIPDDSDRYLYNSLMEEAIASSILEGAVTTREVAKEMLRTSRTPRDRAEQMIVNNYNAILEIRDLKEDKLTPAMLCHLQDTLTKGTLDDPKDSGRFRTSSDNIHIVDALGETVFTPPPADSVERRVNELCDFANAKSKPFVHPVIKAMALHFAIGFIHPFCDGNGRTARAIFYWLMLKSGYWLFEYLPISRIINAAPARYARAYLYTESDSGDVTYFNHYHLDVVTRAIDELHEYLESQQQEMEKAHELVERYPHLNLRQRTMISHLLRHPTHRCTVKEHEGEFRIAYNTARADLYELEDIGLLVKSKQKVGREQVFQAAQNLSKQLSKLSRGGVKNTKKRITKNSTDLGTLFDPKLFD
jgi:Fic family protein